MNDNDGTNGASADNSMDNSMDNSVEKVDKPVENVDEKADKHKKPVVVFGVSINFWSDGTLHFGRSAQSPRDVQVEDVEFLAYRALRDIETERLCTAVTRRQLEFANQVREMARARQQAEAEVRAQQEDAIRKKMAERLQQGKAE